MAWASATLLSLCRSTCGDSDAQTLVGIAWRHLGYPSGITDNTHEISHAPLNRLAVFLVFGWTRHLG